MSGEEGAGDAGAPADEESPDSPASSGDDGSGGGAGIDDDELAAALDDADLEDDENEEPDEAPAEADGGSTAGIAEETGDGSGEAEAEADETATGAADGAGADGSNDDGPAVGAIVDDPDGDTAAGEPADGDPRDERTEDAAADDRAGGPATDERAEDAATDERAGDDPGESGRRNTGGSGGGDRGAGEEGTSKRTIEIDAPPSLVAAWRSQAETAKLTLSEYVVRMTEAGRMSVQMQVDTVETEPEAAMSLDQLEEEILELLRREEVVPWEDLVAAISRNLEEDLEEALSRLQKEGDVRYSGLEGGYRLVDDEE